jgi:CRISPR-associated protein Csx17
MAAHAAPVDETTIARRARHWAKTDPAGVVWGSGGLLRNMIAVLERRLVEQAMRGLVDKPLGGTSPASLSDIAAFLEGAPAFDDARCAALLGGLVWAQPARLPVRRSDAIGSRTRAHAPSLPFAYAALKPLFTPDADLRARPDSAAEVRQCLPEHGTLPIPPGLVTRIRCGAIDEAVRAALARARASGIASPFDTAGAAADRPRFGAAVDPERLAAALLVPIDEHALKFLMERAYPNVRRKEDTDDAA